MVMIMGFTVFYYFDSLNADVQRIALRTQKINIQTDAVRKSVGSILRIARQFRSKAGKVTSMSVEKLVDEIALIADTLTTGTQ